MRLLPPLRRAVGSLLLASALAQFGCDAKTSAPAAAPASGSRKDAAGTAKDAAGTAKDTAGAGKQAPGPRQVRLVPAQQEVVDRRVSATGTLAADEQVVLGTKVPGRVVELRVDLGSPVRRGGVVARLDQTDAKLRIDQARAALQQARVRLGLPADGTDDRVDPEKTALVRQARAVLDEAQLTRQRLQQLWERELVARAQVDAGVSALGVAEGRYQDAIEEARNRQAVLLERRSEVAQAQQLLADTQILSPVDGAISARPASVGEYLSPGAPVATVVKIHPLRLRVAVPERESIGVSVGQTVVVTVEGVAGEHRGRVARISPAITEQSRTLMVEAEVPNTAGALRPGAFAKADIVVANDVKVITVPAKAVVTFAGVEKVLTVDKDRAVEVRIQTGRRRGDRVEVLSGLKPETQVVAEAGNLSGGQPVTVVRGAAEGEPSQKNPRNDPPGKAEPGTPRAEPSQKNPEIARREQRNHEMGVRGAAAGEPSQKNPEIARREQRNHEGPAEEQIRQLTAEIGTAIRRQIVEARDRETYRLLQLAEAVWSAETGAEDRDPGRRTAWHQLAMRAHDFLAARASARLQALRSDLEEFAEDLEAAGLSGKTLVEAYPARAVLRYARREGASLVLGFPLALWGMVVHALPYQLTALVTRLVRPSADTEATFKIFAGLVLYPLGWIAEGWLVWRLGGPWRLAVFIVTLLPTGVLALTWRERWDRVRRDVSAFVQFLRDRDLHRRLLARRQALAEEMEALARLVPSAVLDAGRQP